MLLTPIDLIIVVVSFVEFIIPLAISSSLTVDLKVFKVLKIFKAIRALRSFRLLRAIRYSLVNQQFLKRTLCIRNT